MSLTLRKPSKASPDAIAAFVGNDEPESGAESSSLKESVVTAPLPLRSIPTVASSVPSRTAVVATPSFQRASRAVVERRTGPARRRTTIYFDVDVAVELSRVLVERDQELSDAVNAAVSSWLAANK
jgi:hypothetical protein